MQIVDYKGEIYPGFQALGNAAQFAIPYAKHFCEGTGYDIGCMKPEWSFPGSIPIDLDFEDPFDADNLPPNQVDYIFSSHCLEHVDDWVSTLLYWTERIREGGVLFLYLPHYDQKYWRPWNNRKHKHAFVPEMIVDFMEENGYTNIFSSQRDLNHSFIVVGEKHMGQLNQSIEIKNVLDFYEIKNFVETGTGIGEVVSSVYEADSSLNIHTIEVIEEIYDKNKIRLSYLSNVNWHLGTSFEVLPKILPTFEGNTLFWMDAHFPGADFGLSSYGDEEDKDKRLPLQKELETIVANRDVTNDVFVIDDLRIYEDGPFEGGNWEERKKYGGDGIEFIEQLFEETHYIVRSYNAQGSIILFPLSKDISEEAGNLVIGSVE